MEMTDEQLIALARKHGAEIGFCYDDRSECVGGMSAQQLRSLLQAVHDAAIERAANWACSDNILKLKGTLPEMEG